MCRRPPRSPRSYSLAPYTTLFRASPHGISRKPSGAAARQEAAVVFWVGEDLEAFLAPALESRAATASVVALAEVPGLVRLPYREGGPWAEHEHEHGHGHEHEHEHEEEDRKSTRLNSSH